MRRRGESRAERRGAARGLLTLCALLLSCGAAGLLPAAARAEQGSQPGEPAAAQLDAGAYHSCALLADGSVRCWGFGTDGQLGYDNTRAIGDDETPGSVGPVDLGGGRTATAISAGESHTCALLVGGDVLCWGFGVNGRLGYGNINTIGDNETPGSVGSVPLPRPATAIAAGGGHTCAVLDEGSVRCWGYGGNGQLGYGRAGNVGDTPATTPDKVGPVNLGGDKAIAIAAGQLHTCALLVGGNVRCWGYGARGQLGSGSTANVGDTPATTPDKFPPVNLGGAKATAITAGDFHTCALLADSSVRCWGYGGSGRLGYGNEATVGATPATTPDTVGPVNLGGAKAIAITAGAAHTCARLENGSVRCWGYGGDGRLGYGNTANVGDTPATTPDKVGPVNLGGGKALAISGGLRHTCARIDDGSVRCWGYGGDGRLGYCSQSNIGDDEPPGAIGPVDIGGPGGGVACPPPSSGAPPSPAGPGTVTTLPLVNADAERARGLRTCLAAVAAHANREQQLARGGSGRRRAQVRRHRTRHARSGHRHCLRLFGRAPGRVTSLRARTVGRTQIELVFNAAGTDGSHPPPAGSYVVKQSFRPINGARGFARAQSLCKGACRFTVAKVGGNVTLTVTDLRPHTTYYYAVAARDNVSAHRGPSSRAVKARTR